MKKTLEGGPYVLSLNATKHNHFGRFTDQEKDDTIRQFSCWIANATLKTPTGVLNFTLQTRKHYNKTTKALPSFLSELIVFTDTKPDSTVINYDNVIQPFCIALEQTVREEQKKNALFARNILPPTLNGAAFPEAGDILESEHQLDLAL